MKRNPRLAIKGEKSGTTVKARFSGGVLKPLRKLELSEGNEVTVTIVALPSQARTDWLEKTAGGWWGWLMQKS